MKFSAQNKSKEARLTEIRTVAEAERDGGTEGQDVEEASHLGGGLSVCRLQERRKTSIIPGLKTEEGKQRRDWTELPNCRKEGARKPHRNTGL